MNNSWSWEALISQAGPTWGPSTGPPSRSSSLYLDAQLVMQPAISQAEGEINFLVLHGQGGEGACEVLGSRSWDLSDFRLQRLNPLPGLQEGGEEGAASQISSSAAAPTGEEVGAGAERGVVWKQGESGPQPGLTDAGLVRSKEGLRPRAVHTWAHVCVHTGARAHGRTASGSGNSLGCATPHTGPGTEESKKNVD